MFRCAAHAAGSHLLPFLRAGGLPCGHPGTKTVLAGLRCPVFRLSAHDAFPVLRESLRTIRLRYHLSCIGSHRKRSPLRKGMAGGGNTLPLPRAAVLAVITRSAFRFTGRRVVALLRQYPLMFSVPRFRAEIGSLFPVSLGGVFPVEPGFFLRLRRNAAHGYKHKYAENPYRPSLSFSSPQLHFRFLLSSSSPEGCLVGGGRDMCHFLSLYLILNKKTMFAPGIFRYKSKSCARHRKGKINILN